MIPQNKCSGEYTQITLFDAARFFAISYGVHSCCGATRLRRWHGWGRRFFLRALLWGVLLPQLCGGRIKKDPEKLLTLARKICIWFLEIKKLRKPRSRLGQEDPKKEVEPIASTQKLSKIYTVNIYWYIYIYYRSINTSKTKVEKEALWPQLYIFPEYLEHGVLDRPNLSCSCSSVANNLFLF